jgi:hypothetical protein
VVDCANSVAAGKVVASGGLVRGAKRLVTGAVTLSKVCVIGWAVACVGSATSGGVGVAGFVGGGTALFPPVVTVSITDWSSADVQGGMPEADGVGAVTAPVVAGASACARGSAGVACLDVSATDDIRGVAALTGAVSGFATGAVTE